MDRLWTELTDGAEGSACTLAVKGRQVTVPRQAQGVARMTFEELCARPLGAADYTAVAHDFHTLMIDAIPKLGPEKRNEAKRFVTLIDVLYERKVKLIASAEAPAEALYTEGDGAFEFERTASRLIEMQSADYLDQDHAA
jgi:cell division protein ZapE